MELTKTNVVPSPNQVPTVFFQFHPPNYSIFNFTEKLIPSPLAAETPPHLPAIFSRHLTTMGADHDCYSFTPLIIITSIVVAVATRLLYVFYESGKSFHWKSQDSLSTLIILGSGGHTAEMINVLNVLQKEKYSPRFYIVATTDTMSLQKARVFEDSLVDSVDRKKASTAQFLKIYRSREVGQSYITSVGTTLLALAHALWLMIRIRPQVVLCNGPGTCIPLCVIAFLFKLMGIKWSAIFYVESIARVRRLSLSGLLLYKLRIADQFFVQWPQLQKQYPRAHYVGQLM